MKQEYIDLLRKDIAARLPYKPVVTSEKFDGGYGHRLHLGDLATSQYLDSIHIEDTKIYLRSMSSMTEEERKDYKHVAPGLYIIDSIHIPNVQQVDWLNAHHFDYRGLIEKGLALEAPKGMYEY